MTHQGRGPAVCPQIDVEFLMLQQPRDHLRSWDLLQPAAFFFVWGGGGLDVQKQKPSSTRSHEIRRNFYRKCLQTKGTSSRTSCSWFWNKEEKGAPPGGLGHIELLMICDQARAQLHVETPRASTCWFPRTCSERSSTSNESPLSSLGFTSSPHLGMGQNETTSGPQVLVHGFTS